MRCPRCNSSKTRKERASASSPSAAWVWTCRTCGHRWETGWKTGWNHVSRALLALAFLAMQGCGPGMYTGFVHCEPCEIEGQVPGFTWVLDSGIGQRDYCHPCREAAEEAEVLNCEKARRAIAKRNSLNEQYRRKRG